MHRRFWALALVGAAVIAVAASATAGTQSAAQRTSALKAAPFSWAHVPQTVAARKAKQVLVIGDEQDPSGFNVLQASQSSAWAAYEETPVIRGAYIVTDTGQYNLDLASSVVANKTSLTYHIRPDANWNWGGVKSPVTATDFKYTLDQLLSPNNQVASNTGYININPARTKIINSKTIEFFWNGASTCAAAAVTAGTCANGPFVDYRDLFGLVYPSKALAGQDWNTLWGSCICGNNGKPISDGPFILTNWSKGAGSTEVANPFWYGKKPGLHEIDWKFEADTNSEIQAMRGGELDMIYPSPQTALSQLVNQPGLVYNTGRAYIMEHIDVQQGPDSNPLLHQLWMRQAIFLGINRVALMKALFSSYAPGAKPLNSLEYILGPAAIPHFAKWASAPKKALALLKAHCTGGPAAPKRGNTAIWTCNGTRAEFKYYTTTGNSRRATSTLIWQQQLGAIGIQIDPVFQPGPAVLFAQTLPSHKYDMAEYAYVFGTADPSGNDSVYKCGSPGDFTSYCSKTVDKLLASAGIDFNPTTRQATYEKIDTQLSNDLPIIPLYTYPSILVYKKGIKGAEHSNAALSPGPAWNAEDWSWTS